MFTNVPASQPIVTEAVGNAEPIHAAGGDFHAVGGLNSGGVELAEENELKIGNAEPKHAAWEDCEEVDASIANRPLKLSKRGKRRIKKLKQ